MEAIPYRRLCQNIFQLDRVVFELLAEPVDIHPQVICFVAVFGTPNGPREREMCQRASGFLKGKKFNSTSALVADARDFGLCDVRVPIRQRCYKRSPRSDGAFLSLQPVLHQLEHTRGNCGCALTMTLLVVH